MAEMTKAERAKAWAVIMPRASVASDELAKLCESYTGAVKRPMITRYRYHAASGKLVTPKFEAPVKYLKDAYRADKKRAGNAPPNLWFARPVTPTSNKTRD